MLPPRFLTLLLRAPMRADTSPAPILLLPDAQAPPHLPHPGQFQQPLDLCGAQQTGVRGIEIVEARLIVFLPREQVDTL